VNEPTVNTEIVHVPHSLLQAASDDDFFKLNCPKSRDDTNIEIYSAQLVENQSNPKPIKSQIVGWSINWAEHPEHPLRSNLDYQTPSLKNHMV
jgi:hypothetical protein